HAQATYWVGYVAWQRGDLRTAEGRMREYLRLAEAMIAAEQDSAEYQAEVGYANSNLGTLTLQQRRWNEALAYFEKSRAVNEELLKAAPDDAAQRIAFAQDFSWAARAFEGSGRFAEARGALASELANYDKILEKGPNAQAATYQISARNNIANLYVAEGRLLAARAMYATAARSAEALLAKEPANTVWVGNAAAAYIGMARTALYQGDLAAMDAPLERARGLCKQLVALDPKVAMWASWEATFNLLQAERDRSQKRDADAAAAIDAARRAIDAAKPDRASPSNDFSLAAARVYLDYGDLHAGGDPKAAREAWAHALGFLGGDRSSLSPNAKLVAMQIMQRLGDRREIVTLRQSLQAIDFRHPEFASAGRAIAKEAE
ncbi:MAG: hypothetical protein K2Q06_12630, partial [Parvularculaceae bacterium]|nr:hypothetical protein [Parvularculaceae bacterium]